MAACIATAAWWAMSCTAHAELTTLRGEGKCEVYLVAIADSWRLTHSKSEVLSIPPSRAHHAESHSRIDRALAHVLLP